MREPRRRLRAGRGAAATTSRTSVRPCAVPPARNTAAVQNMARFAGTQPCQSEKGGGRCYDCRSKDRGCNGLLVLWGKMFDMQKLEVVLIEEELGL